MFESGEWVSAVAHHLLNNFSFCYFYGTLQVKTKGFSVFLMPAGMLGTLVALWDALPIFSNSGWGESANIAFLQSHMGANITKRPQPWVTNISTADVHSGDFLALSKVRGRWGGFETLEKWVTGAYAGHTAVCLRDPDNNLWVGESGHENEEVGTLFCFCVLLVCRCCLFTLHKLI